MKVKVFFRVLCVVSIVFLIVSFSFASVLVGKVVDVDDGDTITVWNEKGYYKVRLAGIDTPETSRNAKFKRDTTKVYINGEFNIFIKVPPDMLLEIGYQAKDVMRRLVLGKEVTVEIIDVDRYRRNVGWVWLGSKGNVLVNEYMVSRGLARPYMLRGLYAGRIKEAEKKAKAQRLGIYRYLEK